MSPAVQDGPVRVFVVEDQPRLLAALTKYLSTRPEVELVGSALSGEEAVAAVDASPPQVLLLDLELPGLDGLGVLKRLKPAHPALEVLVLTTFDDETRVYEAMQAGASGYLVKRVATRKVVEGILEVHAGGTVLEPRIARRFWNYFQSVKARPPEPVSCGLTPVELEVLRYLAKGLSNAEVGEVMSIGRRTVRSHLAHVYRKLGVCSHVEAVVEGLRRGLVDL